MLIESDDLVAVFEVLITICCHDRNPKTMCFECQHYQNTIDTIKRLARSERKRLHESKKPHGLPPMGVINF